MKDFFYILAIVWLIMLIQNQMDFRQTIKRADAQLNEGEKILERNRTAIKGCRGDLSGKE